LDVIRQMWEETNCPSRTKLRGFFWHVVLVKDGQPKTKDFMKAAANTEGFRATYHQSYRVIEKNMSDSLGKNVRGFQRLIPYLPKFSEFNPGSKTMAGRNDTNNIRKLFVCPAFMEASITFVRPVMSLDAAHLKSQWRSNLYVASVKSA
jgi:hypothetical protein